MISFFHWAASGLSTGMVLFCFCKIGGIEGKMGGWRRGVVKWHMLVEVILFCLSHLHTRIESNVLVVYFWEGGGVEAGY